MPFFDPSELLSAAARLDRQVTEAETADRQVAVRASRIHWHSPAQRAFARALETSLAGCLAAARLLTGAAEECRQHAHRAAARAAELAAAERAASDLARSVSAATGAAGRAAHHLDPRSW